jgi:hypothetical protein
MVTHEVAQVSEVTAYEGKTLVGRDVLLGIFVLVETKEAGFSVHACQYFLGMSGTS